MKRIIRRRRLSLEEAAKYESIREQLAGELPELIARHHERADNLDRLDAASQDRPTTRQGFVE
jgi:hypothetical protein